MCSSDLLVFPVGRIHRHMRMGRTAKRISAGAPVYLASVLESLVGEIMDLAGNAAKQNKRKRILPRHLQLAVQNDEDLKKIFHGAIVPGGGVLPHVHAALLKKNKK